jgi:hydrogenase nickel incorporation protein HypA/HybF
MHEVSIMEEMASIAIAKAEEANATKIHVIRLRVGRLMAVVPEALQFAHEVVCEGTIAEGATLEIEEAPAVCWCPQCEQEFESGESLFLCPRCGGFSRDLRSGRELELVNMEVS